MAPAKFQFVEISGPSGKATLAARKQASAHRAREAHAQKRRVRTVQYQALSGRDDGSTEPHELAGSEIILHIPESLLVRGPRDVVFSLAETLPPTERLLLNHCTRLRVNCCEDSVREFA
jgi:hypothetical protein